MVRMYAIVNKPCDALKDCINANTTQLCHDSTHEKISSSTSQPAQPTTYLNPTPSPMTSALNGLEPTSQPQMSCDVIWRLPTKLIMARMHLLDSSNVRRKSSPSTTKYPQQVNGWRCYSLVSLRRYAQDIQKHIHRTLHPEKLLQVSNLVVSCWII